MHDSYDAVVTDNGSFLAAYSICRIAGVPEHGGSFFLFTTLRILRVRSGRADWRIGSRTVSIAPGDIIVVNNVEARQFLRIEGNFEAEIFAFLPMVFGRETDCLRLFYSRAPEFSPRIDPALPCFSDVSALLDMLSAAFLAEDSASRRTLVTSLLTAAVTMLLDDIGRHAPASLCTADSDSRTAASVIAGAVHEINANIREEFGVGELAARMNLSRGYFTRMFRACTGVTPGAFIARCRVQNAVRLMMSGSCNVLDAAMASGFGSSSGFYKTFAAVCGMPPGEYLKRAGIRADGLSL